MNLKNNQAWDENWEIIKFLSQGGQGKTSLVKSRGPLQSNKLYVLKELKYQSDRKSRSRMYREVAALKTLNHSGISKFIDSNVEEYESNIPLYLVTEFIEGKTLDKFLKNQNLSLEEIVGSIKTLLETLEKCHENDIVHRDIKPNNIIIRDNDIKDPVLIDFGLSFNNSDLENTDLTQSGEQVGNRFFTLPEQQAKSNLKRDHRSDITQCCGILFFALTKLKPTNLFDHEAKKPHQRLESKKSLSRFSSDSIAKLNKIFDKAFDPRIDSRWQSIPPLKEALMQLLQPVQSESTNDTDSDIAQIREKLSTSPDYAMRQSFQSLANQIVQEIHKVGRSVAGELGSEFGTIQDGSSMSGFKKNKKVNINWSELTFFHQYGITIQFIEERFFPKFKGIATGNEVVLLAEVKGQEIEFLRASLNGELDSTEFSERLKDFYIKGVLSIVEEEAGK
ncbi:serine/threonine-protein kinase [Laspinema olomoucense]|uniref:non-specific serine/threonine protein kinase n=1 Tax=Laspinema olomoucense D3b TaxID=2953688 RepID=A0ABT2N4I3_9CYAN|nr:serine/threonine-protein kinase [Laspinema sp. D3b]MCT7977604.1 serine/threonine protein kinase [Laspinema sp. D3b]